MKNLKVAVPAGIGDTLWVMTKMQSLLKKTNGKYGKLAITVCSDPLRRAKEFLESFDFVDSVGYCDWQVTRSPHILPNGLYNYGPSQPNWHDEFDWFFQCNGHLEHGDRLEEWFPELDTNWDVMNSFQWLEEEVQFGLDFRNTFGEYVVFYLGPESGNSIDGHNRGPLWTPEHWSKLYKLCTEAGLKVVLVGAYYDESYFNKFLKGKHDFRGCLNFIGKWSIQRTLAVVKNAKFIVGYQSGIPITAAYMRIPGTAFWRFHRDSISPAHYISFNERMASAWVPPDMLESKKWLPSIYTKCSPESIMQHAKEYWL